MKQFNANAFYNSFNITIKALQESERITKDALRSLSRECLMLVHYESNKQGDISPVNQVLNVLTPINKKAWLLFMQEFTGFHFDEKEQAFSKKDKTKDGVSTVYDTKCAKACDLLDDPHFNLWTWAERELKVEKKTFKLETIGKDVKKALAAKNDEDQPLYSKADILKAVLDGGITTDDLIELLQVMDVVDVA